jgi:PEP-CTERM motif-containing protein
MRSRTFVLSALLALTCAPAANADLLSGSVSFDQQAGLYTYHYTLDNRFGNQPITHIVLYFQGIPADFFHKAFASSTPPGWLMGTAQSQGMLIQGGNSNRFNPDGPITEIAWYKPGGLQVGALQSGFSFTTTYPPAPPSVNLYQLLWQPTVVPPPGFHNLVGQGSVASPDLRSAPEPTSLLLGGLGALGATAGLFRRVRCRLRPARAGVTPAGQ